MNSTQRNLQQLQPPSPPSSGGVEAYRLYLEAYRWYVQVLVPFARTDGPWAAPVPRDVPTQAEPVAVAAPKSNGTKASKKKRSKSTKPSAKPASAPELLQAAKIDKLKAEAEDIRFRTERARLAKKSGSVKTVERKFGVTGAFTKVPEVEITTIRSVDDVAVNVGDVEPAVAPKTTLDNLVDRVVQMAAHSYADAARVLQPPVQSGRLASAASGSSQPVASQSGGSLLVCNQCAATARHLVHPGESLSVRCRNGACRGLMRKE